jgi:hypothetical protein
MTIIEEGTLQSMFISHIIKIHILSENMDAETG